MQIHTNTIRDYFGGVFSSAGKLLRSKININEHWLLET